MRTRNLVGIVAMTGAVTAFAFGVVFRSELPAESVSATLSGGIEEHTTAVELPKSGTAEFVSNKADELPLQWQNELEFLREEVEAGRVERDALKEELKVVQGQLASINANQLPADNAVEISTNDTPHERLPSNRGGFGFGQISPEQRTSSLQSAGVDEQTIASITERNDRFELARLELIDRAVREGWRRSDEFRTRLEELNDTRVDIRAEIGDVAYDTYLFESGRDNRVFIESIINGSTAQIAGLEVGDVFYSYANSRVYTVRELQEATRDGARGETVEASVQRDTQGVLSFNIERGPLGVTLGTRRLNLN